MPKTAFYPTWNFQLLHAPLLIRLHADSIVYICGHFTHYRSLNRHTELIPLLTCTLRPPDADVVQRRYGAQE